MMKDKLRGIHVNIFLLQTFDHMLIIQVCLFFGFELAVTDVPKARYFLMLVCVKARQLRIIFSLFQSLQFQAHYWQLCYEGICVRMNSYLACFQGYALLRQIINVLYNEIILVGWRLHPSFMFFYWTAEKYLLSHIRSQRWAHVGEVV